jgi:hypothetical protein
MEETMREPLFSFFLFMVVETFSAELAEEIGYTARREEGAGIAMRIFSKLN